MTCRSTRNSFCTWWILLSAYCSVAGWTLSLIHELNAVGYVVTFLIAAAVAWAMCRRSGATRRSAFLWRFPRRLRRPLPVSFFILAALILAGGMLYAPSNWDALSYRVPRVLHWWAAGHWHWIHTIFERLNVRGCGYEWMMAPLIALTRSDRLLFLPNFISFCLLPGLFFSALTGMGVRKHVAWGWMWVLPSGYCYVVQAGGLGNDLLGSFFALAAFAYALRARQSARVELIWLSALAMALSTAVKANNLLLVVIWAVAVLPSWRLLRFRLTATAGVALIALAISFLPTAVLNSIHVHDWTGTKADSMQNRPEDTVPRVVGNVAVVALANLTPPVAPFAGAWNAHIAGKLLPRRVDDVFGVPAGSHVLRMEELATEEGSGMGLGISALIVVSVMASIRAKRHSAASPRYSAFQYSVCAAIAFSLAVFFAASFPTLSEARLLNGYYAFLVLPFLLCAGHSVIVRRRWWHVLALLVMALAALPVVLSPARPLFPAQTVLSVLERRAGSKPMIVRAQKVYSVYRRRPDALAPLAQFLPPGTTVVGLVTFDDLETSLWKPFGSRRVEHVCPSDTPEELRARGLRYIWINSRQQSRLGPLSFEDWLAKFHAELAREVPLTLRGSEDATVWRLVHLQ